MRRILFLLIGLMALATISPVATPASAQAHHTHAMPPGHCHDEAPGVAHICFGCAARPAELPFVSDTMPLAAIRPVALIATFVEGQRPGFDPPPPRRSA